MFKTHETPEDGDGPPECRATVARLQTVLDGEAPPEALDADPHPVVCTTCRERIGAARVLLSVLSQPSAPTAVPTDFSARVVKAVREDRRARRHGAYKVAAGLALAATVLLAVFAIARVNRDAAAPETASAEAVLKPLTVPGAHTSAPAPVPEAQPIRLDAAVAHTEQAIRDTPRPLMESVSAAPKVFDRLTAPLKMPGSPSGPMTSALAPTRKSLAELPGAARAGLEPVTGTAEKAFARFLSDMGSIKPNS